MNMDKITETEILIKVLEKFNQSPLYYSIGKYKDDAICLEKNIMLRTRLQTKYTVYLGERGFKQKKVVFDNLEEACLDVINRLAESDKEFNEMKRMFLKEKVHLKISQRNINNKTFNTIGVSKYNNNIEIKNNIHNVRGNNYKGQTVAKTKERGHIN